MLWKWHLIHAKEITLRILARASTTKLTLLEWNPSVRLTGLHITTLFIWHFSSSVGRHIVMLLTTGVSALLTCSKVIDSAMIWNVDVMAGRGNLGEYDNWGEKTPADIQCCKFPGRGITRHSQEQSGRMAEMAHCTVRGQRERLCQLLWGRGARQRWSREHSRHWSFSNKRPGNTKTGSHTEPPEDT